MRLDIYDYIIFIGLLLLTSCAQVGTVTGGDKDFFAPSPIHEKCTPLNESVEFRGNQIDIVFDEYFKLSSPSKNIIMVPNHAAIKSEVNKKTLRLSWDGSLQENTTYAIYFNRAIKDITEGNDSIMQFVFSTGKKLDTLKHTVFVSNAWSNNPENNCVVGLYDTVFNALVNFTQTNSNGLATLNYVAKGPYKLVAFKDLNQDLEIQVDEPVGFPKNPFLSITTNTTDSVPIRLFSQNQTGLISFARSLSSYKVSLKTNVPLGGATLFLNGEEVQASDMRLPKPDSTIIIVNNALVKKNTIIIKSKTLSDTFVFRHNEKVQPSSPLFRASSRSMVFNPIEPIVFENQDGIKSIDTAKVSLSNTSDTTWRGSFKVTSSLDQIIISPIPKVAGDYTFLFEAGAITTAVGINEKKSSLTFSINEARSYGSLDLDVSAYTESIVVFVMLRGKIIRSVPLVPANNHYLLSHLLPGNYTFKVIVDENENEKWDVGDYDALSQPEEVHLYNEKIKLRANWTSKVTLSPTL